MFQKFFQSVLCHPQGSFLCCSNFVLIKLLMNMVFLCIQIQGMFFYFLNELMYNIYLDEPIDE